VDYGGFAKVPRADLRQIRTDFMTLPLQAVECYLAHVQPIDGTSHWSEEANELFQSLCMAKIIQAELVGYNKSDGIPCVELYVVDETKRVLKVDSVLLERGLAKPADPARTIQLPKMSISPTPKIAVNDQMVNKREPAVITAPSPQQQYNQPPPRLPQDFRFKQQQEDRQKAEIWKQVGTA